MEPKQLPSCSIPHQQTAYNNNNTDMNPELLYNLMLYNNNIIYRHTCELGLPVVSVDLNTKQFLHTLIITL